MQQRACLYYYYTRKQNLGDLVSVFKEIHFEYLIKIPTARVIYDRVLNEKNYFEIPAFLCLNEESQEQENSNQC